MHVSWKWLSRYIDLSSFKSPEELAELLTSRGLEVESTHILSKGFEDVITAKLLKKEKHPDADKLSVCSVTIGAGDPLQIVCGAKNMKEGDILALAQVGALLPKGLKIKKSKIRGVSSSGMLCSEAELGMSEESDGILILPQGTEIGKNLAEVLGRDDTVFELSLTPNRGDCASHIGVAREIAAATRQNAKKPEVLYLDLKGADIQTKLDAGDDGMQFFGVHIKGVKVGPSPAWLKNSLESVGSRSINNVVDATNFVLMELGQPTHAYDAKKIDGHTLSIVRSKRGEKLPLLDDTEIELTGEELVISDERKAVALAGVMGGGNSEVSESTTEVYLECAEFSSKLVRQAATRFQKHTDAAYRFEREIDPCNLHYSVSRLAEIIVDVAGGKVVGSTSSQLTEGPSSRNSKDKHWGRNQINLKKGYIQNFLGVSSLDDRRISEILKSLSCELEDNRSASGNSNAIGGDSGISESWTVIAPSFRRDLKIKEDLAEEVARTIGYNSIPTTVPPLTNPPATVAENREGSEFSQLYRAKDLLVAQGMHEVLTYSFSSQAYLGKFGLRATVPLQNPMSEDQEVMVPSLFPSMIQVAVDNQNKHFGSEGLSHRYFQIRPTFHYSGKITESGVASIANDETGIEEKWRLSLLLAGPSHSSGLKNDFKHVDFFDLKSVIEQVLEGLGTRGGRLMPFEEWKSSEKDSYGNLFHPGQSAVLWVGKDPAGVIGRLHPKLEKENKLRSKTWMADLDWAAIRQTSRTAIVYPTFKGWSEYPPIERDYALLIRKGVSSEQISRSAMKVSKDLIQSVKIFDVYEGAQVPEGMTSVAVRVIFSNNSRSLEESEADAASGKILEAWKRELNAELRS